MARAIAEALREVEVPHAVIDLDELNLVYPFPPRSIARDNLKAIWPRYQAVAPGLKLVIPTVFADVEEAGLRGEALAGSAFAVCELTAPEAVLKERVTAREPNEFWQQRLRDFVDLYQSRTDLDRFVDFEVSTHDRPEGETAQEIIAKAGWR